MEENISIKLKQEFKNLPDNWIAMLETQADKSLKVSLEAINILTKQGLIGIVLAAARPHTSLMQLYEKKGIDTTKIFFLCCVCKKETKKEDNVVHLQNVDALTSISVAINNVIEMLKGKSFLFIDSISAMLIYNDPRILARFIHSVLVKLRLNNIGGILISIEEDTKKEIRAELTQLCDAVIKI